MNLKPIISLREVPAEVPYPNASSEELETIRQAVCDDFELGYFDVKRGAQALWNEIHRLRVENAVYVKRHKEQEASISLARAERDTARAQDLANSTQTEIRLKAENVDLKEKISDLRLRLDMPKSDYHNSLDLCFVERDNWKANYRVSQGIVEKQAEEIKNLHAAYSHSQQQFLDCAEERDAARRALAATHYPETKESVVQRLTKSLHDEYTMAALPQVIAGAFDHYRTQRLLGLDMPTDEQVHAQCVREARALANMAMRLRLEGAGE